MSLPVEAATGIPRHRTAMARSSLSRPLQRAMDDALLQPGATILDYGCGRGGDVGQLRAQGYDCEGWDPVYRPGGSRRPSEIVNLGYVVNVIEKPQERTEVLRTAWALATRLLIVSARLAGEIAQTGRLQGYGDGWLTSRQTFQKFFDQQELRTWVEVTLGTSAVVAAPGVLYVFRDPTERTSFAAARFFRPSRARIDPLAAYAEHREDLEPLRRFLLSHGRSPTGAELADLTSIGSAFGGWRRAQAALLRAEPELGVAMALTLLRRREDLLVYLALTRFETRPRWTELPADMREDVKAAFGPFKAALAEADQALFSLKDGQGLERAMNAAGQGKLTPAAFYIHTSGVDELPIPLRLYEGCARAYAGAVAGANLVKLHRLKRQVSYLSYPAFENDPHPALATAVTIDLQTFRMTARDYRTSINPPVLHRKECFVGPEHPLRRKFLRLTQAEERHGLLDDTANIGTRNGWAAVLAAKGLGLRGHHLVRLPTDVP